MTNGVLDYCANEACSAPIHFGQACMKVGHELVCSGACLVAKLGAVTIIAGKESSFMKLSELISQLQNFKIAFGDREVQFADYASYDGNLNGHAIEDITAEDGAGEPVIVLWDK